jgi:uncharacterized LabA/DUF88 family protein
MQQNDSPAGGDSGQGGGEKRSSSGSSRRRGSRGGRGRGRGGSNAAAAAASDAGRRGSPAPAPASAPVAVRSEPVRPEAMIGAVGAGVTPTSAGLNHKKLLFQKVAIFIDAENIETSGMKHHEGRTDYKKILELVGDREIIRILYYKPIYKDISIEFQNFWAGMGGEIRRPTKNADTFLVIDAVTMADKIDVAIILGGDKDFLPLVWYLRSRGCRVEIWSWPETTSPEMQGASDFYQPLTEDYVISLKSRR